MIEVYQGHDWSKLKFADWKGDTVKRFIATICKLKLYSNICAGQRFKDNNDEGQNRSQSTLV